MRLRRRALLAGVATGLASAAGCVASLDAGQAGTTDTTTSTVASPRSDQYLVTDVSASTEKVAPTHEYVVRVTAVYSTEAFEKESGDPTAIDVSEIEDPAIRDVVKRTLSDGPVKTDSVPDGLDAFLDRYDFFTWEARTDPEDTATHWGIELYRLHPDRPPAVEFDATVVDETISLSSPGAIEFSVTNVGDRTEEIFSGTVPPFGVLWAERVERDGRFLLWRDYAEEGCVFFTDEGHLAQCDIGINTPVNPGERIAKTYELRQAAERTPGDGLAPGRYRVADSLSYSHGDGQRPSTVVDWQVEFEIRG